MQISLSFKTSFRNLKIKGMGKKTCKFFFLLCFVIFYVFMLFFRFVSYFIFDTILARFVESKDGTEYTSR